MSDPADTSATAEATDCPRCGKPPALCVCTGIEPIDNRIALVVLQHPQEQDKELGTARLAVLHLKNAVFRIGLSWPSLARILGRPVEARRWGVVYLGSVKPHQIAPGRDIVVVDRKGEPVGDQDQALRDLEGLVLLDGTWSQAKALWWRNGWMLKCQRIVLAPKRPSRYGKLRREPRREGLSTIEAAALLLGRLEQRPEIETALVATFERLLARCRDAREAPGGSRPEHIPAGTGRPPSPASGAADGTFRSASRRTRHRSVKSSAKLES